MDTFNFDFTLDKFKKIFPKLGNPAGWHTILVSILPIYKINTLNRVSCFLGQTAHESMNFTALEENLNYSTRGLLTVFPKYFKSRSLAEQYARKPEKIANRVYGNRMGNGPEESGDGFRYKGRGLIQLTGKNNYTAFSNSIGRTLDETVEYLKLPEGAVESACWFWNTNKLNQYADTLNHTMLTKLINGGDRGLADRITKTNTILRILKAS